MACQGVLLLLFISFTLFFFKLEDSRLPASLALLIFRSLFLYCQEEKLIQRWEGFEGRKRGRRDVIIFKLKYSLNMLSNKNHIIIFGPQAFCLPLGPQLQPLRKLSVRICFLVSRHFHWPAFGDLARYHISYSHSLCACATSPHKRQGSLNSQLHRPHHSASKPLPNIPPM